MAPGGYSVAALPALRPRGSCAAQGRLGHCVPRADRVRHAPGGSSGARSRFCSASATGPAWAPFVHVARCVSAECLSEKQLL